MQFSDLSARVSRRQLLLAAGVSAGIGITNGTAAQDDPTFSTEVKVVNLLATVRDKKGRLIRDLEKQDFIVLENGKPQNIRYFSRESDLPLTIGLLVDTSLSQGRVLQNERGASLRFLNQILRENKDQAAVVQFDQAVVIRQGLTSSHKDLEDTLALLDTPTRQQAAWGSGTLLYDAVRTASIQAMRKQSGRKAFVVMTDGVDQGSTISLSDAIEAAQRAETLVYTILFSDASFYGGRMLAPSGKGVLARLSKETGGAFFEVSKNQSVTDIFQLIEQDLRSEYSIGFVSNHPVTSSGFRQIRISVRQKGLEVQATDRYYAET